MVNQLSELNEPLWKLSVSQSISPLKKYHVDFQTILNQSLVVYRVSQKFIPLSSYTLIKTLFLHEISRRCLFLYREFQ